MITLEKPFKEGSRRKRMVFLHGFLGDEQEFKHIGKSFERSHDVRYGRIVPPFLKGVGGFSRSVDKAKSPRPPLEKGEFHLIGYSMGGRIALQIACQYPHLIRRLTLISASPGLATPKERRARLISDRALAQHLRRVGMREFLSYWYRQPLFHGFRKHASFRSLVQRRALHSAREQAEILEAFSTGRQDSLWNKIPYLRMPIDLICGEEDTKFCNIAHQMAALNKQIQITVVAKVGHVVHWEAPNAVKERLWNVEYRMANRQNL